MQNLRLFTFTGEQGYHPFSIQVVSDTEENAREIASTSIDTHISKFPKLSEKSCYLDLHIGCYCKNINQYNQPIFNDPHQDGYKIPVYLTFTEWIKTAKCSSRLYNPFEVRVYSCLDG